MGWKEDRRSAYSEKLKDPRWQKIRLQVFERDNWTCQFCCSTENTLSVHHWQYIKGREPWEYDLKDLSCVCWDCHNAEHESRKEEEDALVSVTKHLHWTSRDINLLVSSLAIMPRPNDASIDRDSYSPLPCDVLAWVARNKELLQVLCARFVQERNNDPGFVKQFIDMYGEEAATKEGICLP